MMQEDNSMDILSHVRELPFLTERCFRVETTNRDDTIKLRKWLCKRFAYREALWEEGIAMEHDFVSTLTMFEDHVKAGRKELDISLKSVSYTFHYS